MMQDYYFILKKEKSYSCDNLNSLGFKKVYFLLENFEVCF